MGTVHTDRKKAIHRCLRLPAAKIGCRQTECGIRTASIDLAQLACLFARVWIESLLQCQLYSCSLGFWRWISAGLVCPDIRTKVQATRGGEMTARIVSSERLLFGESPGAPVAMGCSCRGRWLGRECDAVDADEPDGGGKCRDCGMAIENAVCAMQVGIA